MIAELTKPRLAGVPAWPDGWTAAIVGCGSAGSRVARLLVDLGVPAAQLRGYDNRPVVASRWPAAVALTVDHDGHSLLKAMIGDVWFICTPVWVRPQYYAAAVHQARAIFAEKPLAKAVSAVESSVVEAEARGLVTQTGYCWRWHPAALAARAWLRRQQLSGLTAHAVCAVNMHGWPGSPHSYGDALLELSHELDTVRFCLGSGRVVAVAPGSLWSLLIAHETGATSTVDLRGEYQGYFRELTLMGNADRFEWSTSAFVDAGRFGDAGYPGSWSPDDMYRAELADFLRAAIDGQAVRCSWRDGLEIVRWCDQARTLRLASNT